jgi:hypothetical protein
VRRPFPAAIVRQVTLPRASVSDPAQSVPSSSSLRGTAETGPSSLATNGATVTASPSVVLSAALDPTDEFDRSAEEALDMLSWD